MFKGIFRSLVIPAGALLCSAPDPSHAGGFGGLHHHHHSRSTVTTYSTGNAVVVTPATTLATVVPALTLFTTVHSSGFPTVFPASSVSTVFPASSFSGVFPASSFASMTPGYIQAPSALTSLASANYATSFNPSSALSASINQAATAHPLEAQAALASFPSLAQAAQLRGLDGGRFVVALRNFARTAVAALGGQAGIKAIVKTVISDLIRSQIGFDPTSGALGGEIEKLLGEVFGADGATTGSGTGITTGTGTGQCFTIRVCVEGDKVTGSVVNPGGANPLVDNPGIGGSSVVAGGNKVPLFTPLMAIPSRQAPATPQSPATPQVSGDAVPPAPQAPMPVVEPAAAPDVPSTSTPPSLGVRSSQAQHEEVMAALHEISDALKALAVKKVAEK